MPLLVSFFLQVPVLSLGRILSPRLASEDAISPSLLNAMGNLFFSPLDVDADDGVFWDGFGFRPPFDLFHDQFYCLESLLLLFIVAVTHADQFVAILLDQTLGAFLPRL